MRDYFGRGKIQFLFPIDGDCLNSADGRTEGEILYVPVRIKAEGAKSVLVCGKQTEKQGDEFVLDMPVIAGANALTAVADTGDSCKIVVYRFLKAEKGFRISADDNILCLKDIAEHAQEYNSIFDNKYLAIYKEAHEKYGAKAHLNLFYETANLDGFTPDPDYFNLTMMPDKFKEEWEKILDQSEGKDPLKSIMPVVSLEEIQSLKQAIEKVHVSREVKSYIINIAEARL